jgi:hypothetical protein
MKTHGQQSDLFGGLCDTLLDDCVYGLLDISEFYLSGSVPKVFGQIDARGVGRGSVAVGGYPRFHGCSLKILITGREGIIAVGFSIQMQGPIASLV